MQTLALDPAADRSLRAWKPDRATMLLLGTEGPGLSRQARDHADVLVSIPMAHGIDSLNVAMAAAVACYVLTS